MWQEKRSVPVLLALTAAAIIAVAVHLTTVAAASLSQVASGRLDRVSSRLGADLSLWWYSVAAGGGQATTSNLALHGSIGQPLVGPAASGDYRLSAGFWGGVAAPTGQAVVVNTTDDTDDGRCDATHCSLREALAVAGRDGVPTVVTFAIPTTDPGYDPASGVWTIQPTDQYTIPPDTTVDGTVSAALAGASSAAAPGPNAQPGPGGGRPGIEIDGTTLAQAGVSGLWIDENATVQGLVINQFQYGIWISRRGVTVSNCYIGTDPTGNSAKPNGLDGILLARGATEVLIQANLISGNEQSGIRLFGQETTDNVIRGNRIGTNADGTASVPNGGDGIRLHAQANGNTIAGNLISGNAGSGVQLLDPGTNDNLIRANRIGTAAGGKTALPNTSYGVALFSGPQQNVIGPANVVAYNGLDGVLVDGADSFTSTVGNTITANRISRNTGQGIRTFRGGNAELAPPTITAVRRTTVAGTACASCAIEIFADVADEGAIYQGRTTADGSGNWTFSKADGLDGPNITATATDSAGNTSAFSPPVSLVRPTASPTAATPTPTPTLTRATPTATRGTPGRPTATATSRALTETATATAAATVAATATPGLNIRLYLPVAGTGRPR